MPKEEIVANGVSAIQIAEVEALSAQLGIAYDAGKADQAAPVLDQSAVDAAVAVALAQAKVESDAALAAVLVLDAQALAEAQAKAVADVAAVQELLAVMTAKELGEELVVSNLQNSVLAVQASLDAIKSLILPA